MADRITTAIRLDLDIFRRRFLDCPHPDSSEDKRATHGAQCFDANSPPSFSAGLGRLPCQPYLRDTIAGPQRASLTILDRVSNASVNDVQRQALPPKIYVSSSFCIDSAHHGDIYLSGLRLHQSPANVLQQQEIPAPNMFYISIDGGLFPQHRELRPHRDRQVDLVPFSIVRSRAL